MTELHDEAQGARISARMAVHELRAHGIPARYSRSQKSLMVDDEYVAQGELRVLTHCWPLGRDGCISGVKLMVFLGYGAPHASPAARGLDL